MHLNIRIYLFVNLTGLHQTVSHCFLKLLFWLNICLKPLDILNLLVFNIFIVLELANWKVKFIDFDSLHHFVEEQRESVHLLEGDVSGFLVHFYFLQKVYCSRFVEETHDVGGFAGYFFVEFEDLDHICVHFLASINALQNINQLISAPKVLL